MKVYILIKTDFGHREIQGVFDSEDKARAYRTGLELDALEAGGLCGISFYIEEYFIK